MIKSMQKHCNRDNNCEALESSPIEVEKPDQLIGVLSDVYLICGCNIWFIPDLPFKFQITLKGKSFVIFYFLFCLIVMACLMFLLLTLKLLRFVLETK